MRKLFLIMAFALVGLSAKAYDFSAVNDDGKTIYYKITSATAPRTVAVTYDVNGTYSGSVVIPSSVANNGNTYSVTSMGNWTFQYCARLTSVTIGNSVMSIGELCFSSCSGLTSVTIGNSVTSIGEDAFRYCHGLTSVTIPNSVTSIGNAAFGCCGLQNIINNSPNFKFASAASVGTAQVLLPVSHTSDDFNYAADNPVGCLATGQLTIPNSVMAIGESAFRQCSGLTSVTIGNSVASIGRSAFFQCSGLTSVNIPNSVTSIGDWAFSDCSGFTSVTIGNSVTSIGEQAFGSCVSVTSVTSNAITPPTIYNSTFAANYNAVFYVPCVSEDDYLAAQYWSGFNYGECFTENSLNDVDVAEATIYPNPVKDVLNVACSDKVGSVEIFNLLGQKVYAGTKTMIDVSAFAKGNYVVKVYTDKGVMTKKFVVE